MDLKFYEFADCIDECGWGYVGYQDFFSEDGKFLEETAYRMEKVSGAAVPFEEMLDRVKALFGDYAAAVRSGEAIYLHAPEVRYPTICINWTKIPD